MSRQHHLDEATRVLLQLLSARSAQVQALALVRTLRQDHGWIEENGLQLAPQLLSQLSGRLQLAACHRNAA